MKLVVVRSIARPQGFEPGHLSKSAPNKTIQTDEGNSGCFVSARDGERNWPGCL